MKKKFDDDDDGDGQSFVVCVLHSCLSSEGESGRREEGKRGSERESLDANKKEGGTRNEEDLPLSLVIDDG